MLFVNFIKRLDRMMEILYEICVIWSVLILWMEMFECIFIYLYFINYGFDCGCCVVKYVGSDRVLWNLGWNIRLKC